MKVLWFTGNSSRYVSIKGERTGMEYNGVGWARSAESEICKHPEIELGVCFIMNNQPSKVERDGVCYYPIPSQKETPLKRVKEILSTPFISAADREEKSWPYYLPLLKSVVEDFKPDIIQVWGSESYLGLVSFVTDIPVILHIQGIINPYLNAYLPPFYSWDNFRKVSWNPFKMYSTKINRFKYGWDQQAYRERVIYKNIFHYLGRTDWDKRCTYILNQKASYHVGNEILRSSFYEKQERTIPAKLTIITTISAPPYKGYDMVLKTAYLLKNNLGLDFDWLCFGNINAEQTEKITGIRHKDVNVHLKGVASPEVLCIEELKATLYFHSSYIDNSPNSLCEAQILGLPSISTNVGGVSTMIDDKETGFLVPANDPYQAAFLIEKLYKEKELNISMGKKAREHALKRHDKVAIVTQLIETYKEVLRNAQSKDSRK